MFKELFEAKNPKKKIKYRIQRVDSLGNENNLDVYEDLSARLSNQNKIGLVLGSIAFNINHGDFLDAGYKNSGKKDEEKWVKDSIKKADKKAKGNVQKFADEFSKLMKLPGQFNPIK